MKDRIKVAVFDIDGTIFDHKVGRISDTTIASMTQLKEQGIKVGLCTSRTYEETNNVPEDVLAMMDFIITSAGARVTIDGEDIFVKELKQEYMDAIFEYANQHDLIIRYSDVHRNGYFNQKEPKEIRDWFDQSFDYIPTVKEYQQDKIISLAVIDFNVKDHVERLTALSPTSKHVLMQDVYFEITPSGIDKETALEFISQHYGIDIDDMIAFGDGENDASMLAKAGIGIAMANGADQTKAAADYVTKSVSEEGVTKALEKIGLI